METLIRLFDMATYLPPLLVVLTAAAFTLVLADVVGGWLASDGYDRPPMSPLVDMRADDLDVRLHLSLLEQHQRQVAESYRATPVDPNGRVHKRRIGGGHE